MRKFASRCLVLIPIACSSTAFAQVGIGTPDCRSAGMLVRAAHNCPAENIAAARQYGPEAYRGPQPYHYRYSHWRHRRHHF